MTDTFAPAASLATAAGAPHLAPRRSLLASPFAALSEDDTASYRFLLVLRFLVVNLVAAALLGAAWLKGWVDAVFTGDSTQLVAVIVIVFAFGLASCARKIFLTSSEINQLKEPRQHRSARVARYVETIQGRDGQSRALAASALKLKLGARIASIRHLANSLVFLGLIGTVIGFIIALSGIDPDAAADVESIGPMVSTLISGMSVALYTTLVGAILNIWLMVNYRLLESGTVTLVTTVVELGSVMDGLEQLDEDDGGTVFRDVIMLALAGFVAMVMLLLPHLNPPGKSALENSQPPGNVIVEVRWPDEIDSDVDLWVEAPGDVPVGYSNKGGVIFNLLRDDLGKRADATGMNYEVSYSRGIPAGEYTVNVHLYRNTAGIFPIPVTVVTSVKKSPKESARQVLASKIELVREGEELTVYRFRLSEEGDLVPGSVHSLQRNLRAWRAS